MFNQILHIQKVEAQTIFLELKVVSNSTVQNRLVI
jgi:hypothetical protein